MSVTAIIIIKPIKIYKNYISSITIIADNVPQELKKTMHETNSDETRRSIQNISSSYPTDGALYEFTKSLYRNSTTTWTSPLMNRADPALIVIISVLS
mmetsp:Transcript_40587/g.95310  ORF Transcript_40587/g.95310 Transcript_40587/m.95310 type:complete len:98 (+) Transcript_40587:59-352(+)